MNLAYLVAGAIVAALIIYLFLALLRPEMFE